MAITPLNLTDLISKYLKYMDFVKSSSPLTLKAYQKDLLQAFGKKIVNETELLGLAREALNGWASLSLS
ncbi:MAG: hypothetical protein ACXWRA_10680, partial [Pseudobdellovibrionaceae bacterium]